MVKHFKVNSRETTELGVGEEGGITDHQSTKSWFYTDIIRYSKWIMFWYVCPVRIDTIRIWRRIKCVKMLFKIPGHGVSVLKYSQEKLA